MDSTPGPDRPARLQLRLVQVVLLILLTDTALVGFRIAGWPLMTWTTYTRRTTPRLVPGAIPAPGASAIELRVGTRAGPLGTVFPVERFPMDRISAAEFVREPAFDDADPESRDAHRL